MFDAGLRISSVFALNTFMNNLSNEKTFGLSRISSGFVFWRVESLESVFFLVQKHGGRRNAGAMTPGRQSFHDMHVGQRFGGE